MSAKTPRKLTFDAGLVGLTVLQMVGLVIAGLVWLLLVLIVPGDLVSFGVRLALATVVSGVIMLATLVKIQGGSVLVWVVRTILFFLRSRQWLWRRHASAPAAGKVTLKLSQVPDRGVSVDQSPSVPLHHRLSSRLSSLVGGRKFEFQPIYVAGMSAVALVFLVFLGASWWIVLDYQNDQVEAAEAAIVSPSLLPSLTPSAIPVLSSLTQSPTAVPATEPITAVLEAAQSHSFPPDGLEHSLGDVWYVPDLDTRPGFDSWLLLLNPAQETVTVSLRFVDNCGQVTHTLSVPATSRRNVWVNTIFPGRQLAAVVTASGPLAVEHAVYHAGDGDTGPALGAASVNWYLPAGVVDTTDRVFLSIFNPATWPAFVHAQLLGANGPDLVISTVVLPDQVAQLELDWPSLRLANEDSVPGNQPQTAPAGVVGFVITGSVPIVVGGRVEGERGMRSLDGATSLSSSWYVPLIPDVDGDSVLVGVNPEDHPVGVTMRFPGSLAVESHFVAASRSAFGLSLESALGGVGGVEIEAEHPIVVGVSVDGGGRGGSYFALGASSSASTWYLPEGFGDSTALTRLRLHLFAPGKEELKYTVFTLDEVGGVEKWESVLSPRKPAEVKVSKTGAFGMVVVADGPLVVHRVITFRPAGLSGSPGIAGNSAGSPAGGPAGGGR